MSCTLGGQKIVPLRYVRYVSMQLKPIKKY